MPTLAVPDALDPGEVPLASGAARSTDEEGGGR
jgi:hypothetical protein